jgi:hypothetical protein
VNIPLLLQQPTRDVKWLRSALQAAIELELSTIPPYLCALWSIKDSAHPAYDTLYSIAMEEMLHMGLACNMLTTIGGTPVLNTPDVVPRYPGPLPGNIRPALTVALSGLTKDVIRDVFMEIEYPDHGPIVTLMGETYPTIGAFYTAINDAFVQNEAAIVGQRQLISPAIGLTRLTSLAEVQSAIMKIKEQGEGTAQSPFSPTFEPDDLAHYYQFAELFHGRRVKEVLPGVWKYEGDEIPFPDVYPMVQVPAGGYTESRAFDTLYTGVLDRLQSAWENGQQSQLSAAVQAMRQLEAPAVALMQTPLPSGNGNFGPSFQLIRSTPPTAALIPGGGPPTRRRRPPRIRLTARATSFPAAVINQMATREHRIHHFLWHEVRNGWLFYDAATRSAISQLGWEPPRPALRPGPGGRRVPILDNASGEDFLYMHRQMISQANAILSEVGDPEYPQIEGWPAIPDPTDVEFPVPPAWATGDADFDAFLQETKSGQYLSQTMRTWERDYRDRNWLAGRSLGELGALVEFTIHNRMHMRWCSDPGEMRPDVDAANASTIDTRWDAVSYDWLGDTYSSHVHPWFWRIHGWVDDCIEAWKVANGVTGRIAWTGTWVGKMPTHPAPHSLHAMLAGSGHQHDHQSDMAAVLKLVLASGVRCRFYDPIELRGR